MPLIERWEALLRLLYFPEESVLYVSIAVRLTFAAYYLPLMAMVLAITHSCMESIVYTLVVPGVRSVQAGLQRASGDSGGEGFLTFAAAIQERFEVLAGQFPFVQQQLAAGYVQRPMRALDLDGGSALRIALGLATLIPYGTLAIAVATVGHKVLATIAEAMVDAFTQIEGGTDYPLVAARLAFVLQNARRTAIFLAVGAAVNGALLFLLGSTWWTDQAARPADVHAVSVAIELLCVAFAARSLWSARPAGVPIFCNGNAAAASAGARPRANSALQHSAQERSLRAMDRFLPSLSPAIVRFATHDWWLATIHRIRYVAVELLLVAGLAWAVTCGPIDALANTTEALIHLNLPHLIGFTTLAISVAIIRRLHSVLWLLRRGPRALLHVLIAASPYLTVLVASIWVFYPNPAPTALLAFAALHLVFRSVELSRAFEVRARGGGVQWVEIPPRGVPTAALVHSDEDDYDDNNNSSSNARGSPEVPVREAWAITLEDAFERGKGDVGIVGLDIAVDIRAMQLRRPNQAAPSRLERRVSARRPPPSPRDRPLLPFLAFALPRLLLMQGSDGFSGARFSNARRLWKAFTGVLLIVFSVLVVGMVFQSCIPALHPPTMRLEIDGARQEALLDHIFVRLAVRGRAAPPPSVEAHGDSDGDDDYPRLCQATFAGDVSVFELSVLSLLVYLPSSADTAAALQFMNAHMGTHWALDTRAAANGSFVPPCSGDAAVSAEAWHGFAEFHDPARGVRVASVRGTDLNSILDILQNINMYFEAALYQMLANVVPLASVLPSSLVTDYIRAAAVTDLFSQSRLWSRHRGHPGAGAGGAGGDGGPVGAGAHQGDLGRVATEREYYLRIMHYVEGRLAAEGGTAAASQRLLLTGHSLGGAIAHIVGARLRLQSVGFNAPGIVLPYKKFGIAGPVAIHARIFNLHLTHDIVPFIGWQGGEQHRMVCGAERRELCHAMESAVAGLWHSCPSVRRRYPRIEAIV